MTEARKVLLVDGYNVLRSSGRYGAHRVSSDDYSRDIYNGAREALINDVASFVGNDWRAIIVFDGAGNPQSRGESQHIANIEVIFSAAGVSADTVIEDLVRKVRAQKCQVLVVTSDAQTQWAVLGSEVTRMSAAGFVAELEALTCEQQSDAAQTTVKTTLAERIDPEMRERLRSLLH
jgi:predicted RNA-binding protein with PIN domain